MPLPLSSDEALCAGAVLLSGGLGFFGARLRSFRDLSRRARLGAVIEARAFANEPPRPELPAVPSGVVGGSVISIVACFWLHCRDLIYQHLIFTTALVACAISSGVWLMIAASVQNAAERERHARIEAFIDDANAPVPPPVRGLESMPAWFDLWSWTNAVVFFGRPRKCSRRRFRRPSRYPAASRLPTRRGARSNTSNAWSWAKDNPSIVCK